ncbi:hypothetical protein OnM2_097010 [Erysiphe neolycopersici]|uniref:Uncharacterized protein n=1 Tax=Erysiphe neolycopersici TaxID=212602 RepID=A0A420HAH1_9PEZI|nr:hypothetical protein OnM2_097010 [Erysiphe neolycopersici]
MSLDGEKCEYSEESSDDEQILNSATSSRRDSSGSNTSHKYLLTQNLLVRPFRSHHDSRRLRLRRRLPSKVTRYLGFTLIFILIIFILSLVRASAISSHNVEVGNIGHTKLSPPERWKSFPFLTRYYGGVRSLTLSSRNIPEYPILDSKQKIFSFSNFSIPLQNLPESVKFEAYSRHSFVGNISGNIPVQQCFVDTESKTLIPQIRYYEGRPFGFPENIMGSYEILDLPENICFERYGRLGPYGYGYLPQFGGTGTGEDGDKEGSNAVWKNGSEINQVDYRNIDWAHLQRECYNSNKARFKQERPNLNLNYQKTFSILDNQENDKNFIITNTTGRPENLMARTAVVVRVWDDFEYHEEDILNLRAMISELSIGSGGEYDVHLLVQVKNEGANPIWADSEMYQKHLNESVPQEFRGISTLWSVTQMLMLYQGIFDTFARGPDLPIHGPYRGLQMAMQYFAHIHPEYDFFWHWEIDTRYSGHYYHLFSQVDSWSTKQPRKGLWERSSRFYIPSVHGSWEDFKHTVRVQTEIGIKSPDKIWSGIEGVNSRSKIDKPIWGPERPSHEEDWFITDDDQIPPTSYENDKYQWGVGEPADLITFNPLFDPDETTWLLAGDITGYNISEGLPARRASIITSSRMSKRLLQIMHRETAFKKHHAFSEMWAPTVALHHGLKAVYVPHPIFIDRQWPSTYLSGIMNAGKNGATGGARTSVFGAGEHNFLGMTWYYNSGFAPNIWRRWLGLKVNNDGGAEFELSIDETKTQNGVGQMRGGEGRMCIPPMLLHPVKGIKLPVEGSVLMKLDIAESSPIA